MAAPLEYLTGNSFITYPFRDGSSLKDNGLTFTLSDDCFLDALVVSKSVATTKAYLSNLVQDGTNFELEFTLLDDANGVVSTITIIKSIVAIVERTFFSYSDSDVAIKLVPGKAFIDLGGIASFDYAFSQAATQISSTAFIPYMPRVTGIDLYNINQITNNPELLTSITNDDVEFQAGTNFDIINNAGVPSLDIIAGAGTGLYDGCNVNPDTVKMINFIPGNEGRFFLSGDGCYTNQRNTHGLILSNICKPKCTAAQITNYGHYHNRLKDGLFDTGDYAETVSAAIVAQMNDYNDNVVPLKRLPTFQSKFVQTTDGSLCYFSFAVGLFNPSDSPITIDLHVIAEDPVVPGMEYFVIEHTPRITMDETTCYLPTNLDPHAIDLVDFEIPCINFAILEFVVTADVGVSTTLTIESTLSPFSIVHTLEAADSVC